MPKEDQGVQVDRYQVIPRVLIFVTRQDSFLLIKGAPTKRIWANRYNGVGGHVERGEDPLSAARRELFEETGLMMNNLRLVGVVTVDTGQDIGIAIYVFQGEYEGGRLTDSSEGHLEWVKKDQFKDLPLVEDLPALLGKIMQSLPDSPPFSAQYSYDETGKLVMQFA